MWDAWTLQQDTNRAASDILDVKQWASDILGCEDWITAIQFDNAVGWFGHHVQNRLHEYDKLTNQPKYDLEELLSDLPIQQESPLQRIRSMFGKAVKVIGK